MHLFINKNKLSDEIKLSLKKNAALFIHPYNKIYKEVKKFTNSDVILVHPDRMNYALYNNIGKEVITEISSSNKLDAFPAEQGRFICPSFEPISSFGEHVTIVRCILLMENSFMIVTV
ncbi:TPA: aminopeptidase P family N-terminal domain-containing protein [Clostridium botulinum]|uniref:aminopeptidase P family N-terminal domain-containing protein n=1 Tax=Clostridium TaxID=1485 RepID=UPI00035BADD1|nr:aminopeptidase P family N-terminal domain-containing protein [Clostridium botulinum]EPS50691.1 metallopeptidase, family M24 [Clostridium botulinum CFSAN002367]KON10908.1 peptidase M24 [Clostridium botulinum]MCW6075872.1 aminopeptidase P family N-terminal domain-containing protein [Clostridium sporogenes]RUT54854.1 peptidase, M24 family protein [Clostridium botulinum]